MSLVMWRDEEEEEASYEMSTNDAHLSTEVSKALKQLLINYTKICMERQERTFMFLLGAIFYFLLKHSFW